MNHHEWTKRRQEIRATLRSAELHLLALGDDEDEPCDCNLDEVRIKRMPNGQLDISTAHDRYCRLVIDRNVASMEAGLKVDRLFRQIGQSMETSQDAIANGKTILANFHARRALDHLARCRDLAQRHGHEVPPGWDELATVLADLAEATAD